ncbi:hypothetical protein F0P96_20070 [Hymenobacter busanensis]|uniref:Uncharacterized protein n=2 Tax=Hymenobacter busanensis TaxID=2607656 RepID=A0A7L4ZXY3_9BACT|nr:hypothetical protein [Hymenobacter busanensis]KAA9325301.1 hypothetical protein F0P96_20070 [Hymenobacter busanensis]QHJ07706.1 hypothetical protein GUY19_10570 [Hymenobacter busanensis]
MQDTYSSAQLQDYGRRLAARVCDAHFSAQPVGATLDGPAVLRLTPVRQLNLFVVQQLLAQWTREMAQLRSPYFDFEDAAVRQALTQLMNLLSRRIRLTRATYEPLLAQAATDTLRAVLDPAATFADKLFPVEQPSATPTQLRDALRYVDINKPLFESFIESLPADVAQERDYLLNRFRLHTEAHYKELQSVDQVLHELSALLPVYAADLREPAAAPAKATEASAPKPAQVPAAPAPAAAPAPVAAAPEPAAAPAPAAKPAEVPEAQPAEPVVAEVAPAPAPVPTPVATTEAAPAKPVERVFSAEPAAPVPTLAEKLAATAKTSTLADKLAQSAPAASTLADVQPKVESLRNAISINQRFSFINELFNGENMEYHAAIEHLDTLPTADAARRYVQEDLTNRYQWVRKDEHLNKLLRLIDRKFA